MCSILNETPQSYMRCFLSFQRRVSQLFAVGASTIAGLALIILPAAAAAQLQYSAGAAATAYTYGRSQLLSVLVSQLQQQKVSNECRTIIIIIPFIDIILIGHIYQSLIKYDNSIIAEKVN